MSKSKMMWGYGARMRLSRAILGMETNEFAARFSVARRTVQRIERGADPLPEGLWDEVCQAVSGVMHDANAVLDAAEGGGEPERVLVNFANARETATMVHAYAMDPDALTPVTRADVEAMEGEDDAEVPGTAGPGGANRGEAGHAEQVQTA